MDSADDVNATVYAASQAASLYRVLIFLKSAGRRVWRVARSRLVTRSMSLVFFSQCQDRAATSGILSPCFVRLYACSASTHRRIRRQSSVSDGDTHHNLRPTAAADLSVPAYCFTCNYETSHPRTETCKLHWRNNVGVIISPFLIRGVGEGWWSNAVLFLPARIHSKGACYHATSSAC